MKRQYIPRITILIISVALSAFGCKDKDTAAPSPSGSIFGNGFLYDQYGDRVLTNLGGDSIKIQNNGALAVTNVNGSYSFSNLKEGIYSFVYSKAGYGNMELNNAQFIGGGNTEHDFKLAAIPNFNVASIDSTNLTNTNNLVTLRIYGTLASSDPNQRTVLLLIGSGTTVTTNPATYVLNYTAKTTLNNKTGQYGNSFFFSVPVAELYGAGFASQSNITIAATGVSGVGATASIYEDPATGRMVYTAVNSGSPVIKTLRVP